MIRSLFFCLSALTVGVGHAADLTDCSAPETMTARLKAEGQRSIVSADIITPEKAVYGLVITAKPDLSVGYVLQSDQPSGKKASRFCIRERLTDLRVFDARKPGIPPEALLKAPEAEAARRCDELAKANKVPRRSCGSFNAMKTKAEAHGERVMVQGFTESQQLATVSGHVGGTVNDAPGNPGFGIGGSVSYSSLPDGATIIGAVIAYPEYTPYGLTLIAGR